MRRIKVPKEMEAELTPRQLWLTRRNTPRRRWWGTLMPFQQHRPKMVLAPKFTQQQQRDSTRAKRARRDREAATS